MSYLILIYIFKYVSKYLNRHINKIISLLPDFIYEDHVKKYKNGTRQLNKK